MFGIVERRCEDLPLPGGSVGWSVVLMCQGRGVDPWSGHIRESTGGKVERWANVSFSPVFSLSGANEYFYNKKERALAGVAQWIE